MMIKIFITCWLFKLIKKWHKKGKRKKNKMKRGALNNKWESGLFLDGWWIKNGRVWCFYKNKKKSHKNSTFSWNTRFQLLKSHRSLKTKISEHSMEINSRKKEATLINIHSMAPTRRNLRGGGGLEVEFFSPRRFFFANFALNFVM